MAEFTIHAQDLTGLAGKVIVLTGGSSGIGLATVHLLLSLGAVVVTGDIHPLPESHLLDANNSSFTTTNGDDNNSNNSNVEEQKLEQQQEQQQKQPPPRLTHVPTDVTSWSALTTLFRTALNLHGHIDHVFAGAGVLVNGFDYLGDGNGEHASASSESTDESAEPTEPPEPSEPPNAREWAINFKAVVNTAYLGMYHMRRQRRQQQQQQNGTSNGHGSAAGGGGGKGGSIVLAASITSYILFRAADYCMSKHAVLGFMRGVLPRLIEQNASFAAAAAASGDADDASNGGTSNSAASAIRLNCISPSWTASGMVNKERFEAIGRADELQPPEAVAQTVALLMADEARQGQVVYSRQGKFWEIEERVQRVLEDEFLGGGHPDLAIKAYYEEAAERKAKEEEEAAKVKEEATKQEDATKKEEETTKQQKAEQEPVP